MMSTLRIAAALVVASGLATTAHATVTTFETTQDYMTSGFFTLAGGGFVRGQEAASGRNSNRATSNPIFGVGGENAYFDFDFDPSAFTGPVSQAVFRVETLSPGFFAPPSVGNPAEISLHSLTSNALASIDPNLDSGAGSYVAFRDAQITTSSIVSTISIDSLGIVEWDITGLVNEWIANGDANFEYSLGTSALLDPDGDAAVAFVNSSWSGLTTELTGRIVVIPAPASGALLALGGLVAVRRRR